MADSVISVYGYLIAWTDQPMTQRTPVAPDVLDELAAAVPTSPAPPTLDAAPFDMFLRKLRTEVMLATPRPGNAHKVRRCAKKRLWWLRNSAIQSQERAKTVEHTKWRR